MSEELKPCPCCGQSGPTKVGYWPDELAPQSRIRCVCGMQTIAHDFESCSIIWNTRAETPQSIPSEREEIVAYMRGCAGRRHRPNSPFGAPVMTNPDELIEKLNLSQKEGYDWAQRREGSDGSGLMAQMAWRCAEAVSALSSLVERNRRLVADLAKFDWELACEGCGAPLFDGDDYVSDPDDCSGCWAAMTDRPSERERPCYAYRVGKEQAGDPRSGEAASAAQQKRKLEEALTPSGDTKTAYIGERALSGTSA